MLQRKDERKGYLSYFHLQLLAQLLDIIVHSLVPLLG